MIPPSGYVKLGTVWVPESWSLSELERLVLAKKLACAVVTLLSDEASLRALARAEPDEAPIVDIQA